MSSNGRLTLLFVAVLSCPLLYGGCASVSAEPISAQVVETGTGQPLAGVVVVVHWDLHQSSFTGDALPCGAADVEEAVTDQDGRFRIPGWGPVISSCGMRSGEPLLVLFKPGYDPKAVNNPLASTEPVSVSRSVWDGKTIELSRHPNLDLRKIGSSSYADAYRGLNQFLLSFVVDYPGECNWKKIPNMMRAILAQDKAFREIGSSSYSIATQLIVADDFIKKTAPQCGSPKEFIDGLKKQDAQPVSSAASN